MTKRDERAPQSETCQCCGEEFHPRDGHTFFHEKLPGEIVICETCLRYPVEDGTIPEPDSDTLSAAQYEALAAWVAENKEGAGA